MVTTVRAERVQLVTAEGEDHVARLLLLVDEFSSPGEKALDGLTKLAKLDFLLRYPAFLDRLTSRLGLNDADSEPARDVERLAVTDPMVRYKYGPWDDRYYALVGSLIGRGLAEYTEGRGKVALRVTLEGQRAAGRLRRAPEWQRVARRARFLRDNFDLSGTQLKALIYDAFPALVGQTLRSAIPASPAETDE